MRQFTVRCDGEPDRSWVGFNQQFHPTGEVHHIVLLTIDGELDVYAIDQPNMVSDLFAYLTENECGKIEIIGCFSRRW